MSDQPQKDQKQSGDEQLAHLVRAQHYRHRKKTFGLKTAATRPWWLADTNCSE
jgi:hypothetical protein